MFNLPSRPGLDQPGSQAQPSQGVAGDDRLLRLKTLTLGEVPEETGEGFNDQETLTNQGAPASSQDQTAVPNNEELKASGQDQPPIAPETAAKEVTPPAFALGAGSASEAAEMHSGQCNTAAPKGGLVQVFGDAASNGDQPLPPPPLAKAPEISQEPPCVPTPSSVEKLSPAFEPTGSPRSPVPTNKGKVASVSPTLMDIAQDEADEAGWHGRIDLCTVPSHSK